MRNRMNLRSRSLIFAAILLVGCKTTHDVAVTSYHVTRGIAVGSYRVTRGIAVGSYRVATAPVHYALRRHGDESITTETTSDVSVPGQPVPAPEVAATTQRQSQPVPQRAPRTSQTAPPVSRRETAEVRGKPSPSSRPSSTQLEFPTAKAVAGKPGYVLSPFDRSGRYVDVSGYTSGSKVKDPWTDKIFIVP
jgi:hypothetical protein